MHSPLNLVTWQPLKVDLIFSLYMTNRVFSTIPINQVHKQNNTYIKGNGGAVGLTDIPSTLRHWMVAGPEGARVIEEFHDEHHH